jgi:two-component system NarL family response regulator
VTRVRVLVVDDVDLFRTGLSAALRAAGFDICGEAANAEGAVTAAEELLPDVVVLDILMPGLSGLEVVEKIMAVSPASRIILLTASESVEDLLEGIRSGARGYLVKDTAFEGLAEAIHDVMRGGAAVSSRMGGKLFDILRQHLRHQDIAGDREPSLTGREVEILRHVAAGETSREIGRVLYISENTVKNHIRNILDKLGLHSRSEAVLYAVRESLIEL